MPVVGTDKKAFSVNVRQLHSSDASDQPSKDVDAEAKHEPNFEDEDWHPGFVARFPWLGFCALLIVLLASIGAVIVLIISNQKPQADWIPWLPPNVILSGLNNAANIAIGIAVGQGIAIAWWRRALKGATVKVRFGNFVIEDVANSVKELHHSWAFSTSLSTVLIRFKYFNAVALAALTTKFTIVDGMLFQKASEITTVTRITYLNLTAPAWRQFPVTGTLNVHGNATASMTTFFTDDLIDMQYAADGISRDGYPGYTECRGLCFTNMTGIGFSMDCQTTTKPVDYGKTAIAAYNTQASSTANDTNSAAPADTYTDIPLFSVEFEQIGPDAQKNYSRINMKTVSTTANTSLTAGEDIAIRGGSCPSLRTTNTCELRPALINYPLTIENYTSEAFNISEIVLGWDSLIDPDASENYIRNQAYNFTVVENIEANEWHGDGAATSLGGFLLALQASLGGSVLLSYNEDRWNIDETGTLAPVVQDSLPQSAKFCDYRYGDPKTTILGQLNMLTFLAMGDENLAMNEAEEYLLEDVPTRTTSGEQHEQIIIFRSRWPYLAGALASTIFCILCILPAYWGFWELGREVSLGPFEIANALNAPVFDPVQGGAGNVRQILKTVGRKKMQYGESENGKKLAFHDGPE